MITTIKTFCDKTAFSCNAYVMSGDKGTVVIDPGYWSDDIREYVKHLGRVDAVLLTHAHIDHVRGVDGLKVDFPETPIYISGKELPMLKEPSFICGHLLKMPDFIVHAEATPISEGKHTLGGYEVEAVSTPGHTFGALTYVFREENVMFCGDAILHYAKVPLNRPTGSAEDVRKTLETLLTLNVPQDMMAYCGHRESVTIDAMRRESPDMIEYKNQKEKNMTDYEAISNLVVAERMYRVSHRNEELAKCYAEDAHIHTSWQSGGRDSFVGRSSESTVADLPIVNRCNPPLIHQKGNRALVEYPMTTTRVVMVHGEEAVLSSYMLLIHRVEKRDGEWKIVDMFTINEFDTLEPAIPGVDLKINPDEVRGLRKSYRWLTYTRQLAGGTISPDLVGSDRPEGVKKIYDEGYKWLDGKE